MQTVIDVVAIVRKGEEFMLGKKKVNNPPYEGAWHTLGGSVEDQEKAMELFKNQDYDNEYFQQEVKRQVKKQSNIEVENIRNIVPRFRPEPRESITKNRDGVDQRFIFLEYFCDYAGGEIEPNEYFETWEWHTKEDLKDMKLTPPSREMYVELGWDWLW